MTRPRFARSNCCVPFCRRTSTLFRGEWLCGDHWRLVDRPLKAFRTRRLREAYQECERFWALAQAAQEEFAAGRMTLSLGPRAYRAKALRANARWQRLERATWARMKRQAIERGAGT